MNITSPIEAERYFENKLLFTTGPVELDAMIRSRENINIVDVRGKDDYERGHIPSAVSMPKDTWDDMSHLKRDTVNIIYCYSQVCHLAARAARDFAAHGYPVMELEGGFEQWAAHDMRIESQGQ